MIVNSSPNNFGGGPPGDRPLLAAGLLPQYLATVDVEYADSRCGPRTTAPATSVELVGLSRLDPSRRLRHPPLGHLFRTLMPFLETRSRPCEER